MDVLRDTPSIQDFEGFVKVCSPKKHNFFRVKGTSPLDGLGRGGNTGSESQVGIRGSSAMTCRPASSGSPALSEHRRAQGCDLTQKQIPTHETPQRSGDQR